jgi:hypothetical protein
VRWLGENSNTNQVQKSSADQCPLRQYRLILTQCAERANMLVQPHRSCSNETERGERHATPNKHQPETCANIRLEDDLASPFSANASNSTLDSTETSPATRGGACASVKWKQVDNASASEALTAYHEDNHHTIRLWEASQPPTIGPNTRPNAAEIHPRTFKHGDTKANMPTYVLAQASSCDVTMPTCASGV